MAQEEVQKGPMAQEDVQNGGSEKAAAADGIVLSMKVQFFVEAPKATEAVQFYKDAFGAVETGRTTESKRKADQELPHFFAELSLAGTTIIVSDYADETPVRSPVLLETKDLEAAIAKAVEAGAVAEGEIVDGGSMYDRAVRVGKVKDPFGYVWTFLSATQQPAPQQSSADVEA